MMSIRFRLFLLLGLFTATTLTLAHVAYGTFTVFRDLRRDLELSYQLRDEVQATREVKPPSDQIRRWQICS
jgi:hypothetical protein